VLVSAFVPRFKGIRENANDIARKSHVQTIANALLTYNSSEGDYPDSDGCVSSLQGKLTQYLTTIPQDPQSNKKHAPCATNGSYAYWPINKTASTKNDGMVVAARMENTKSANFVYRDDMKGLSYEDLQKRICDRNCDFANGQPYFVVIQ
jgi:hypothetical protein